MDRRHAIATIGVAMSALSVAPKSYAADTVKLAFITDMSGPFSGIDGPGGTDAIRMAVKDFGGKVLGKSIEVLSADHQNKPDVGANQARKWWDQDHVDLVICGGNSAVNLAITNISKEKKKVFISAGGGADSLTGQSCQPYFVRYTYSTAALATGTGSAVVKRGGKKWYFITADYAFGYSMQKAATDIIKANGGEIVGSLRAPIGTTDFSAFILKAQNSGADVLGLAVAGDDFINAVKTADEFGVTKKMNLVAFVVFLTDIHGLGLKAANGMYLTTSWYWDLNDETRSFANRFYASHNKMPTSFQAAEYSSATTYLKAIQSANTTDSDAVMKQLKSMKINDMYTKGGYIRADGTMVHNMYLMQVKSPSESKRTWDYFKEISVVPGDVAFAPTEIGGVCTLNTKSS